MCYCPSPPIPTFCDLTLRPCNWPRQGYLYHMSKCYKKSWICPLDFFPESQLLNVDQHRQASGDLPGSIKKQACEHADGTSGLQTGTQSGTLVNGILY